ncbi:MAG: YicC family protein [Bacteroidota bacterium]|nr:YicC family protein [Bacteroidota bacterium]MDX5404026.1 YicC family protein [Bacteroidota bacterium]MDX5427158.1 YicC family protein [Bacteroidota bacterium]MDX5447607.1 YicC family protein [Bacteroidota bacterium]MDX5505125.1 YicC family protein [Bacteroidota bacterium]
MLYSMTGFGKEVLHLPAKKVTIEVKSLNSKQFDLNLRMPSYYREKEAEVRSYLSRELVRGKVDFSIYVEVTGPEDAARINTPLLESYLDQLGRIAGNRNLDSDMLAIAMRLPDVLRTEKDELDENEWNEVWNGMKSAISKFNNFRQQEGAVLQKDFLERVEAIRNLSLEIEPFEPERMETVKARLKKQLDQLKEADSNRFEQELIFYLEKLDITEEKVRLRNHLDYFIETMEKEPHPGKKLGFICQEIGREINTTGSKANHAEIQKCVVQMKDELEKIKEQMANVL